MKHLRQYIRQILKEETTSERDERRYPFVRDLLGSDFDTGYRETTDDFESSPEEIKVAYRRMAGAGRKLKKAFAAHVDRKYVDSLEYVHWTNDKQKVLMMLAPGIVKPDSNAASKRDEVSVIAYLPGKKEGKGAFGKYGMVIDGHVTLLANDMNALHTGYTAHYKSSDPHRTASSGANKGIGVADDESVVLSAEDWNPRKIDSAGRWNEALLDNWKITGLIVPDDEYDSFVKILDKVYDRTKKEYNLWKASMLK